MRELPILFTTEMVNALLADLKTQTRRLRNLDTVNENPDQWEVVKIDPKKGEKYQFKNKLTGEGLHITFPYGDPGDLLYVRETYCKLQPGLVHSASKLPYLYFADIANDEEALAKVKDSKLKWKPNIHMPKEAARIWLQLISRKPQRVFDMSEAECKAEGVQQEYQTLIFPALDKQITMKTYAGGFARIWVELNGAESYNRNPWVWALKFKVISKTGRTDKTTTAI
jgi:hypothetical protein